jgi:hypothetical protein
MEPIIFLVTAGIRKNLVVCLTGICRRHLRARTLLAGR